MPSAALIRTLLRALLIAVVVASVPVRGWAAWACPGSAAGSGSAMVQAAGVHAVPAGHHAGTAVADGDAPAHHEAHAPQGADGHGTCAGSMPCCAAGAPAPEAGLMVLGRTAQPRVAAAEVHYAATALAQLERPPRGAAI